jgi:nucleotide-binding universal stress UspA family protein
VKNILVAVDAFENLTIASPLLQQTIALANAFSSKVWLLHVAPPSGQSPYNIDNDIFRREVAHQRHDEHKLIQQLAKTLREQKIDAASLMVEGEIGKTIRNEADRLAIDLIILGCHRQRELVGALTRDIGKSLLGKCSRPLLYVPLA